jgi:lysophospholipase L1-like esterase
VAQALPRSVSRCVVAAACGLVLILAGTLHSGSAAAAAQRQKVLFFGDSLSYEAGPYLKQDFNPSTTDDALHLFPGTAMCDWLGQIDKLTRRTAPDVVVLQFIGNHLTRCIARSSNFVAQYGKDLGSAISQLRSIGVKDIVVDAGPVTPIATWWTSLVRTYRTEVASFHSRDIIYAAGADAAVESATGGFVTTLRCLRVEVKYHKCVAGSQIKVRANDKVHFCPIPLPAVATKVVLCPVYASGAYRFAKGLARAVWTLDPATDPYLKH